MAPGQVNGVGDGALLVLVGFADVEERDAAALQQGLRVRGLHLVDGRLRLVQKVSGSGHARTSGSRRTVCPARIKLLNTTSGVNIPRGTLLRSRRAGRSAPEVPRSAKLAAVELHEAIQRRAMVRSFSAEPVDRAVVDGILLGALRSPTAGNTGGTAWMVLQGQETSTYFEATTDEVWRTSYRAWAEGLQRAPVVLLSYASPATYVARYGEPDKSAAGLGDSASQWPVPYWFGDAAFGVMAVLLGAVDAGLGACILGSFRGEAELARRLHVPDDWRLFCAVVLGRPDGKDHRSASLERLLPPRSERIHWGRW